MDIPSGALQAPLPLVDRVDGIDDAAQVLALDGRAADISSLPRISQLRFLWISRVSSTAADAIGQLVALERLVIHEYRVADLTPLTSLARLRSLALAGSPKLKSLAGLERLSLLEELILFANCNFTDLAPLQNLPNLTTLCLEGAFSKQLKVDSLAPLAALQKLRHLRLASLRVADRSLRPLHALHSVRQVFVAATFPARELRSLAAALPNAQGQWLDTHRL